MGKIGGKTATRMGIMEEHNMYDWKIKTLAAIAGVAILVRLWQIVRKHLE
jgi:hypothetical protein